MKSLVKDKIIKRKQERKVVITAMTKSEAWDYAIGMMQVDGAKPSEEFLELVEKEINGEITTDEMRKYFLKKYDKSGRYQ